MSNCWRIYVSLPRGKLWNVCLSGQMTRFLTMVKTNYQCVSTWNWTPKHTHHDTNTNKHRFCMGACGPAGLELQVIVLVGVNCWQHTHTAAERRGEENRQCTRRQGTSTRLETRNSLFNETLWFHYNIYWNEGSWKNHSGSGASFLDALLRVLTNRRVLKSSSSRNLTIIKSCFCSMWWTANGLQNTTGWLIFPNITFSLLCDHNWYIN